MSKVTKWAVETAKEAMNGAIRVKMAKWDKANPPKAREFSRQTLAEIAVSDPAWQRQVITRAKRGYSDIDIRDSDFESNSPLVADAIKKNRAVDATRNKAREEVHTALCEKRDQIARKAIIGDCEAAELLKEVNEFCRP
jgi:hypothetical protein